jgi:hypothetical protein
LSGTHQRKKSTPNDIFKQEEIAYFSTLILFREEAVSVEIIINFYFNIFLNKNNILKNNK